MTFLLFVSLLPQFLVSGLTPGSIYGMTALGFTLIYNATGVVNFAQGEFITYGALIAISCYSGISLFTVLLLALIIIIFAVIFVIPKTLLQRITTSIALIISSVLLIWKSSLFVFAFQQKNVIFAKFPVPMSIIIATLAAMLLGALLERLAIRPARHASVITLIIITIGASMLLRGLAMSLWGTDPLPMRSFSGDEPIFYQGVMVYPEQLWTILSIFFGSLLLLWIVWRLLRLRERLQRVVQRVPLGAWREPVAINTSGLFSLAAIVMLPFLITSYSWRWLVAWKGPTPFSTPDRVEETMINAARVSIAPQQLWVIGIMLVTMFSLWVLGERTQVGKAMRACAINRQAAQLVGIPVLRMVTLSFALSGLLGGLAGAIFAPIVMGQYNMGTMLGVNGFAAAILGGMGNPLGAVLGGLLLGMLESLTVAVLPSDASGYKEAIAAVVMLLIMIAKPSGLLGRRNRTV